MSNLSSLGLVLAGIMSVLSVLMGVARKKAVEDKPLFPVVFWCHVVLTAALAAVWVGRWRLGHGPALHGGAGTYAGCLTADLLLLGLANWYFFKAMQEGAMSTAVPFLTFTSVWLIPTGFVVLGELPAPAKLIGVLLIAIGSVLMHRSLFAHGWAAPVRAIFRDKGSRYMLLVSVLLAVSSPIDKKLILMTDIYTQAAIYAAGMSVFFLAMSLARGNRLLPALHQRRTWIALAGLLDASSLLLQFAAYRYLDVVIVISIQRAGIVLAVVFGWLVFRESHLRDKLVASTVMFAGAVILYAPLTLAQAAGFAAALLVLTGLFLRYTRDEDGGGVPASAPTS